MKGLAPALLSLKTNPFAFKEEAVKFAALILVSFAVAIPTWANCVSKLSDDVRDQLQNSELNQEIQDSFSALQATVRQMKASKVSSYALLVEKVGQAIPLAASVPTSPQDVFSRILEKLGQDAEDLAYQNEQLVKITAQDPALAKDIETLVARNGKQIRKIEAVINNKSNLDAIVSILE